MNYFEKGNQWWEKLNNGKGDGVECIFTSENGQLWYRDIHGVMSIDCVFFCQKENGRRTTEMICRNNDDSINSKERIFIKDMKKVIFIDKNGEGHGYGYNEKGKLESFVLYIRIKGSVRLMWAGADCDRVNFAVETNLDNPTVLDCLVEFLQRSSDVEQTISKESEI